MLKAISEFRGVGIQGDQRQNVKLVNQEVKDEDCQRNQGCAGRIASKVSVTEDLLVAS